MIEVTAKYAQPEVVSFWRDLGSRGLQAAEARMLARYAPPPARVLDLGCGTGRALLALVPKGYRVIGLDLTWAMVSAARRAALRAAVPPLLLQGDMTAIPCPSASFDVVIVLVAALQHIPGRSRRRRAFVQMARVLRPGGTLILALDNVAPALTCYAWWGRQRVLGASERFAVNGNSFATQAATGADRALQARRDQMSAVGWHARGLARTLRWRTWNGFLGLLRRAGMWPGERGDTAVGQVSAAPTPGKVYYHIYEHDELLADAASGGLEVIGYHSGRELSEGRLFRPRVRQLDKQVLYAFRRPQTEGGRHDAVSRHN